VFRVLVDDTVLDGLLNENSQLIDQLMMANGLDFSSDNIDLEAVDELDIAVKSADLPSSDTFTYGEPGDDFLSSLHHISQSDELDNAYPLVDSPLSSISTLPSEPSSPLDINLLHLPQEEFCPEPASTESDLSNLFDSFTHEPVFFDSGLSEPIDDLSTSIGDSVNDLSHYSNQAVDSDCSYSQYSVESSPNSVCMVSPVEPASVESLSKEKSSKKKKKFTPYSKLPANRKERKKQQNKEAAIRYREKKKNEAKNSLNEETILTNRNTELKTEVLNLEREIACMKELLSDVFNIHSL